jgi:Domain of unknown function (DUF1824)
MSASQPTDLTKDRALKILKSYDCTQTNDIISSPEKEQLLSCLLLIISLSESENIGICADDSQQGFTALADYLQAFGYPSNLAAIDVSQTSEPVYIKYNTHKMSYYLDKYTGKYRGVLIYCQSEDDEIAGMYGHFPLDLFIDN